MSQLSRIIAGCMSWGAWGKQFSTQEMISQINLTLEAGITTFDHADIYGDYTTEHEFGNAFFKSSIPRETIQIISKCGIQSVGNTRNNKIKHYQYSKEYIKWSVEKSISDLQCDYLDVLLLHRPSPLMHPNEISEAVLELKEQGKILEFGLSNFTNSQTQLIQSQVPVFANQIEFSLTQHKALFDGTLDYMFQHQIQPMSWSPLGTFYKEDNKANNRIQQALIQLTNKYNATENQLLLMWILKHPSNICPVIGTTQPNRIANAVKALEMELELEDWFQMLTVAQGHKVP